MFIRSYTVGLVPVAVMLAGLGLGVERASAQTSYDFSATYNTLVTVDPTYNSDLGIGRATITGVSTDAPYGLTNFTSNTYSQFDPTKYCVINNCQTVNRDNPCSTTDPTTHGLTIISDNLLTNVSTFNANPAAFGLQGEPILSDRYYGGSNELFGTASDMAKFDFEQGTVSGGGTITITGGTGIFENATGEITFTENDKLTSTNLTEPFEGRAILNFSVQTAQAVPEPSTNATLVGASVIGFGLLLRRHRRKSAMSNPINRGEN